MRISEIIPYFNTSLYYNKSECPMINRMNVSFIQTYLHFSGIPEYFLLNIVCGLAIICIFIVFKIQACKQHKKAKNEGKEIGWLGMLYKDVYHLISEEDLRRTGSLYIPLNDDMSFIAMMHHSFFGITNADVLLRCGVDATQYLVFHQNVVYFMFYNTLLSIGVILPANIHGDKAKRTNYYEQTTIYNLSMDSKMLWIHVIICCVAIILCGVRIREIAKNLNSFRKSEWRERTVEITNISEDATNSRAIEDYFTRKFPEIKIEDIKLCYEYETLIKLTHKLKVAEKNLSTCKNISRYDRREVMVKKRFWYCFPLLRCRSMQKDWVNGHLFYSSIIDHCKEEIAKELNELPKYPVTSAFVTFKKEVHVKRILAAETRSFSKLFSSGWFIKRAPATNNIIWENVGAVNVLRNFIINFTVFFVAVFLTTPTIIVSVSKLDKDQQEISAKSVLIGRFFLAVFIFILSTVIPALVTYSSHFLDFTTKSHMYKSTMKKSVLFLILTVVILPSLGLTSVSFFVVWTFTHKNQEHDWSCIFIPDNGAFFVDYIVTSGFIGIPLQLLRIPDILWHVYELAKAKSEAEMTSIGRGSIFDFSFGIQYSHSLLVFTLVTFLSLACPVISFFGLLYFLLKFVVDRYNIYFACSPSEVSYQVHFLAIKFLLLSMVFQTSGFFLLAYVRGGWHNITYPAACVMWITIGVWFVAINPCEMDRVYFHYLMPVDTVEKRLETVEDKTSWVNKVYQPLELVRFIPLMRPLDKFGNPVMPRERVGSIARALEKEVRDMEFLESDTDV